jgi:hypothetical protein
MFYFTRRFPVRAQCVTTGNAGKSAPAIACGAVGHQVDLLERCDVAEVVEGVCW